MMEDQIFRPLSSEEIAVLEQQGNFASDWSRVSISDDTYLSQIRQNRFFGHVCLGTFGLQEHVVDHLVVPEGVYNSTLRDVTVGNHCSVQNVGYLSGYMIGDYVVLSSVNEMTFGSLEGAWMEVMNECGGRRILPFPGMRIADAYLWARYRDREKLVDRLEAITTEMPFLSAGVIGNYAVVRNTKEIRDVTILSEKDCPSSVTDCIALAQGVVGYGCRLEQGVIAQRFLLGENVHLEFGLRLNDTVVGDNSTLARCEIGNSMIFPAHEQHHNNSFLIAALLMGQSNVAAGATLGSNHNGRTADNELSAGRGFWPGLCASVKHSSRFASYCLLAKSDFPSELNITLPFSLVNNNVAKNRLEVMPAYWWMYNMYALNRNITKFAKRDRRRHASQHIEFDPFAPDTAEEMLVGRGLLRMWTERAYQEQKGCEQFPPTGGVEVLGYGMEHNKRKTVILKPGQAFKAYEEMLIFYAVRAIKAVFGDQMPPASLAEGSRVQWWINLGGQLVARPDMEQLLDDIESRKLGSWQTIHERLDELWKRYPADKAKHAYQVLCELSQLSALDEKEWNMYCARFAQIERFVQDQIVLTRKKDDDNEFRKMTYWNEQEMQRVLEG